jgi:hypothetical protein
VPAGKVSEREIKMLLEVEEGEEFAQILEEMAEDSSSKKVKDLVMRLPDYTEEIEENNQVVLDGVFLAGDRLIREDSTQGSLQHGVSQYLKEVVEKALTEPIKESVSELNDSVQEGDSVYLPVALIRRRLKRGVDPDDVEAMRELRNVVVDKIEERAKRDELRDVPKIGRVLVVWGEWSDSETLEDWSGRVIEEDSELLEFVGHFRDNYELGQYIHLNHLGNFVDVGSVEERIIEMEPDELDDDKQDIREVFLDTIEMKEEGNYPDRAYVDYSIENWVSEE